MGALHLAGVLAVVDLVVHVDKLSFLGGDEHRCARGVEEGAHRRKLARARDARQAQPQQGPPLQLSVHFAPRLNVPEDSLPVERSGEELMRDDAFTLLDSA